MQDLIRKARNLFDSKYVSISAKAGLSIAIRAADAADARLTEYQVRLLRAVEDVKDVQSGRLTHTSGTRVHKFKDEQYSNITGCCAIVTYVQNKEALNVAIIAAEDSARAYMEAVA
jgi:hypothetical protein